MGLSKIDKIDHDEFLDMWSKNTPRKEMCKHFEISSGTYINYCQKYNLKRTKEEVVENIKKSMMEKYDVDNAFKSKECMEKAKQTLLNKYGADHPSKIPECIEKAKQTCLERYGVEKIGNSEEIRVKIEKTCTERYGGTSSFCSDKVKTKAKQTIFEKYGVESPMQSDEIKQKVQETNMRKYGVVSTLQNLDIKNKISQVMIEKFGTDDVHLINYNDFTRDVLSSKDNLEKFILSHEDRSIGALVSELNCERQTFVKNVHKYDLWELLHLYRSSPEYEINCILNEWGIKTICSERLSITPMEIDIFCPDYNIGIEFNGNYWHSSLKKEKEYHFKKSFYAQSKGIRLIHIYEYEWENPIKKNIIISMLKIAFGNVEKRIYARDCEIRKVTNKEARSFNEHNHLQGHKNAQVTYGLFYKSRLVQLMSFSYKPNKGWWEIERGCPGSNNIVVGGVSKLFTHFIREYSPQKVFSYCDFNKFDGKGYEAIGMKLLGYTGPDMKWLIDDATVKNRCPSKHRELQNIAMAKIWGAGSKKYLWENPNIKK